MAMIEKLAKFLNGMFGQFISYAHEILKFDQPASSVAILQKVRREMNERYERLICHLTQNGLLSPLLSIAPLG
jgi:hypothetical protein